MMQPTDFWHRLQTGVEVAVVGSTPDRLLGVRDGFTRYFERVLERQVSVVVVPHRQSEMVFGLASSDEAAVARARRLVGELTGEVGDAYHFLVASEGGCEPIEAGGERHYFVRNWTVVASPIGEAWGGSGAVQLPASLLADSGGGPPVSVPGTRRRGGLFSSLTNGQETRRSAIALSTFNALSSLFYGILQSRALTLR